jgi:hypothetical protein
MPRDHSESSTARVESAAELTPVTRGNKSNAASSDPGCDHRVGRF